MRDTDRNSSDAPAVSANVIAALESGNKIEAIKIIRGERNLGLKEAKDAVDDCVRSHPALAALFAARMAERKRAAWRWLVVLVGAAIFAYWFVVEQ